MLLKAAGNIRDCFDRAAEARSKAAASNEPETRDYHLQAELGWLRLADSYMFVEQAERFLADTLARQHRGGPPADTRRMDEDRAWHSVEDAPFDRDIELAVIDYDGAHALVFPCRRVAGGWINAQTKAWLDVQPNRWREWEDD